MSVTEAKKRSDHIQRLLEEIQGSLLRLALVRYGSQTKATPKIRVDVERPDGRGNFYLLEL